ncbi:MAG: filamentous hemagglutinin N-terminal domain-containing protein, partial [Gammaproteobacteria bacterium]|nr:filamentous hemagglutinin N-terminal domain-containing protein [Gammaproteobacteria bacterium]
MDRHDKNNQVGSRGRFLVFCLVLSATRAFAAGVEVDGATDTLLGVAPNGVPVVNIANPNARGLSHNSYRRFDVGSPGLILNNATQNIVGTQLGGQIFGNSRLDAPARLILNEVTSSNRSVLNGYTEVAGQGADVVIANPNGISVNGAGFINAPRVTLTTGVPLIDGAGELGGFNVRGGDITIDGAGLDTGRQDATSIYTHFLNLNAKLHARDLDIVLGRNQLDYPGRRIVSRGQGSSGRVLLDSSALGGMYANKIVLVGTEKGLGMNLPPEVVASNGDIQVSSDGRLVLHRIDAGGQIELQAGQGIDSDGTVFAAGDVAIATEKALTIESGMIAASGAISIQARRVGNDATLVAGLGADGLMNDHGSLDILAEELSNRGEIISTGALDLNAIDISNHGLISAAADLTLNADTLVNDATLFSARDARLLVRNDLGNHAGASIFTVDNLVLAADPLLNQTAQITNELGLIQSLQGDIDIHAARFDNIGAAHLDYELIFYVLGHGREVGSPGAAMTIDLAYSSGYTKHNHEARNRWVREVLNRLSWQAPLLYQANAGSISGNQWARFLAIETRLLDHSSSTPALLDSGRDLNLDVGQFVNQDSVTAAARDIGFTISGDYRNIATSVTENVIDYQYFTQANHSRRKLTSEDRYSSQGSSYYIPLARSETVSTNTVTQAGRGIAGEIGGRAVNSGILNGSYEPANGIDPSDFSAASIFLPANDFGLFVKSTAPDSHYLVETNPRFADLAGFVNSGYLLDQLDFSGGATLKRLGDGFYEAKLIRDSVYAQTGRRYLDADIRSDNQQFQYLMDNALVAQRELELSPGIALTRDQVNRLNRDIVWLEAMEVAGETVLAPVVYLANGPKSAVRGGRIIAGGDTRLRVASLVNDGLVESGNDLALDAEDRIDNQGLIAAAESLR